MIIDHIGLVVRSLEDAARDWRDLFGYEPLTEAVENTRQRVRVMFLGKPGSVDVKLVEPTEDASPVSGLAKRGGGLHHLCFRCQDVASELARLEAEGLRVLSTIQPGEAFENNEIAFVSARNGLTVELIDTDRRARRRYRTACR